jgi:hypothetical protein
MVQDPVTEISSLREPLTDSDTTSPEFVSDTHSVTLSLRVREGDGQKERNEVV